MRKTEMTHEIIAQASTTINASVEKVWNALVDPAANRQFMLGAEVKSGWKEGDAITWSGQWQGKPFEDKGWILKVKPRQLLQYSHYSPLTGEEDIPENYHVVTITLKAQDGGTWVELTQDKNVDEAARQHSEQNWKIVLEELKKFVETK